MPDPALRYTFRFGLFEGTQASLFFHLPNLKSIQGKLYIIGYSYNYSIQLTLRLDMITYPCNDNWTYPFIYLIFDVTI